MNVPTKEYSAESVLKFIEHSSQKPKISNHILTKGEVYLANEWFAEAFVEFKNYLSTAYYQGDHNVTTHPSFHRQLFAKIGKVSKDVQDKEGFADMVNKLIDISPDSLSIQLNAHLVLAKFYQENGILEKTDEHIQKIDSITANLPAESISLQLSAYLSLTKYYRDIGMLDNAGEYIHI